MRERLLLLQSLCGLSDGEAAKLCAVSPRAWDDFKSGAKAPRDWPDLLAPLEDLRDLMNRQISGLTAAWKAARAAGGEPSDPPVFILYTRDRDMLPDEVWPFASVQRRVTAEGVEALDLKAETVVFDPAAFDAWRAAGHRGASLRQDRMDWAVEESWKDERKHRFSLSLGYGPSAGLQPGQAAHGWAVYRLNRIKRVKSGQVKS